MEAALRLDVKHFLVLRLLLLVKLVGSRTRGMSSLGQTSSVIRIGIRIAAAIHQRSAELDKINVLEGKIAEEVASINEKMEQMRRDMNNYSNESEDKNSWEARKRVMLQKAL